MAKQTVSEWNPHRVLDTPGIQQRTDLSFVATSDDPGVRSNWNVSHDGGGYWGDTVAIGQRMFAEVQQLAGVNEEEAYDAIRFALTAREWNHVPAGVGWGIEDGFARTVAAAAIIGLRALRGGEVKSMEVQHG